MNKNIPDDIERFAPPISERYFSLGFICQTLKVNPGQVRVLMEDAEATFDRMVDGICYVNGETLERIVEVYNRISTEIQSVAAIAPNN